MKAAYYEGLSDNAHENPSYWFDGMTRDQLPQSYRGSVPHNATGWDLWNGFLAALADATTGSRGARRWVISAFVQHQDQETIDSLIRDGE